MILNIKTKIIGECKLHSPIIKFILSSCYIALFFIPCFIYAQKLENKEVDSKNYFVLAFPSTDCINCKSMGLPIINNNFKNNKIDSLIILSDNDAGAYYLSKNETQFKKFKQIVDKDFCNKLAPHGKSTISYITKDTFISIDLKYGFDSLLKLINYTANKITPSTI